MYISLGSGPVNLFVSTYKFVKDLVLLIPLRDNKPVSWRSRVSNVYAFFIPSKLIVISFLPKDNLVS